MMIKITWIESCEKTSSAEEDKDAPIQYAPRAHAVLIKLISHDVTDPRQLQFLCQRHCKM